MSAYTNAIGPDEAKTILRALRGIAVPTNPLERLQYDSLIKMFTHISKAPTYYTLTAGEEHDFASEAVSSFATIREHA